MHCPSRSFFLSTNYLCGWSYNAGNEQHLAVHDSVTIAASHQYGKVNPVKYIFMGKNYRKDWAEPVRMPVFHISSYKGGYTIEKLGGGQQTKSLHLKDKNGVGWVLRTVDKDVTNALPSSVQNTFVKAIVQDQISASYPYAPLTITRMARTIGVPTDTAVLFYVPDDTALGAYRPYFANTVCFLRRKNLTRDGSDTYDTQEIKSKLFGNAAYHVMQEQVLRARLLDMLIGDWDRHDKQWEWGVKDSMANHYVYPIPEDRDQAYFLAEGFLPIVIRMVALPHLVGFKPSLKAVKDLNNKAYGFDRYFMSGLVAEDWERIIKSVQSSLTDDVIKTAVSRVPREVYALSGPEISTKLIKRRDDLLSYGMDYYRFLAWEAQIPLTSQKDIIRIEETPGTAIAVTVSTEQGHTWFSRSFLKKETRSIRFLNFGKDDAVTGPEDAKNTIRIYYDEYVPDTATVSKAAVK
jgi:hypothetical protein